MSLVDRSEEFNVSRQIVSVFIGDIRNTRSLLVVIITMLGALLIIGTGIIKS